MPYSNRKASVTLVALCLIAVLGIALASYLAVSNQSMKLSNRSYAKDVSRSLAEIGLERALRPMSGFSSFGSWTLSGITASETLTTSSSVALPAAGFGNSGITPTVNIKVYHYRDSSSTNKALVWTPTPSTAYAIDDYVWYRGVWYLCIATPGSNPPSDTTYWKAAPGPWSASANYYVGNVVVYGGSAYRCTVNNVNRAPPNANYWTVLAAPSVGLWNSTTNYAADDVVIFGGIPYRARQSNQNTSPPDTTNWLGPAAIYSEGVATLNDSGNTTFKTQLCALIEPAALFPNALGAIQTVTLSSSGTVDSYNYPLRDYNSSYPYQVGDVVYYPGTSTYYRCILDNTNQAPPSSTYWATSPLGYSAVVAGDNTSSVAVSGGDAVIAGYVAASPNTSAPHAPWVQFNVSTNPKLTNLDGSVTSPRTGSSNVDETRISRSPYVPQFDIQSVSASPTSLAAAGAGYGGASTTLVDGAATLGSPGVVTTYRITATHDNPSGINYAGLDLYNSGQNLTIAGPVVLNVSGLFRIYQGKITINTGASLEVYFTGQLDIGFSSPSATAGIFNTTNDPQKMVIVGSSNTGSHYIRTRNPLTGVVYMPNTTVTMQNSSFTNHLYGAISAQNVTFSHTVNFHYDTSLRAAGKVATYVDGPYIVSQLRELTDPSEKITLP